MCSLLTLSTVAMFGLMLNAPTDNLLSPDIAPPTSSLPLPPIQEQPATQQKSTRSALKDAQSREAERKKSSLSRTGSTRSYQQRSSANTQQIMPTAPTGSSSDYGGNYYQYLPPTAGSVPADSGGGGRTSDIYGPMGPTGSPTRARPGTAQSYTSMQNAQEQNRRQIAARNATATSPQQTSKPYSGYQQSTPGISPYLNLFRTGNNYGTIDNYSTLVKPALDQGRANQQFGADIHNLETSSRVQGLNILRLDRETQNLHGVSATQYYMNYGDYYPNAGR